MREKMRKVGARNEQKMGIDAQNWGKKAVGKGAKLGQEKRKKCAKMRKVGARIAQNCAKMRKVGARNAQRSHKWESQAGTNNSGLLLDLDVLDFLLLSLFVFGRRSQGGSSSVGRRGVGAAAGSAAGSAAGATGFPSPRSRSAGQQQQNGGW